MTEIEEKLAHLIRTVDDLSDVIARQDRELDRLRSELLQRRGQLLHDDRPAADDVDTALVHRPQGGTLLTGHHQQFLTHRQ